MKIKIFNRGICGNPYMGCALLVTNPSCAESSAEMAKKMEHIKEICFFIICGQTLLHFQSGKKYEKICRMILQLLILAVMAGFLLAVLQSAGLYEDSAREASGKAVAGDGLSVQESIGSSVEKQLAGMEESDFMNKISLENMIEEYTCSEICTEINNITMKYGIRTKEVQVLEDRVRIIVSYRENAEKTENMPDNDDGNPADKISVEKIEIGVQKEDFESGREEKSPSAEELRKEIAARLQTEPEKLEVITDE